MAHKKIKDSWLSKTQNNKNNKIEQRRKTRNIYCNDILCVFLIYKMQSYSPYFTVKDATRELKLSLCWNKSHTHST